MKLRQKTTIIIISISSALFLILYAVALFVVKDGFYSIEVNYAQKNVTRVVTSFDEITRNLVTKSADWAKWDDLYNYVQQTDKRFESSNLAENTISDLHLNLMLFFDDRDSLIYQRQYTNETGELSGVDIELRDLLCNTYKLTKHDNLSDISSGVIHSRSRAVIIVSRPILTSAGEGPSHGTLIFGKFINQEETDHVSAITNVDFDLLPISAEDLPEDMKRALSHISSVNPIHIIPLDKKSIVGYTIIEDIINLPQLIVRVTMPREIYNQSNATLFYLLFSFLGISLVYGVFFILIMENIVTSRTTRLSDDVVYIGKSNDHSLRVRCSGRDELTTLSESINTMLAVQECSDRQLRIHNNEMQLIMNTIQIGLFSLDDQFRINPVHSRSSEHILGMSPLAGCSIFDALRMKQPSKLVSDLNDFLTLLKIDALPDEEMQGLSPCEELSFYINDATRWVRIEFHKMERGEPDNNHILVEIKDITEEKILIEEIARKEKENIQLKIIAEDPDLFREFIYESLHILEQTEQLSDSIDNRKEPQVIHEIFRNVHRLKGASDSFGLMTMADFAGELENQLDVIRSLESVSKDDIQMIQISLLKLSEELYQTIQNSRNILGDFIADQTDITLRVPIDRIVTEIASLRDHLCNRSAPATIPEISRQIDIHYHNLRLEPVKRGFAKIFRTVPSLIKRLGKNCVFKITGDDLLVDCMLARKLNTPLLHTLRNAFDHGIETTGERLHSEKSETGTVSCGFSREGNFLVIEIYDDGKGIDTNRLMQVAQAKGFHQNNNLVVDTEDSLVNLLFLPGFTTTKTVTSISGRGVGLDSVYTVIKKELGGTINVTSRVNFGTTFTFKIPDSADNV